MEITVLRLGHRPERDKRITTHCALVARAFGAKKILYSGIQDIKFEQSIRKATTSWGGPFEVEYTKHWKAYIKAFKGTIIHLTMYGKNAIPKLSKDTLIIIGGEKVPGEVYELADYNIAIGNQPHSEVAALAVFLEKTKGIKKSFKGAEKKIVPQTRGKKVISV